MNAVITVIGKNNIGIISSISVKITEFNINVLDVNQTNENFTMFMIVSLEKCDCEFNNITILFSFIFKYLFYSNILMI